MLDFFKKKPYFIIKLNEDSGVPPIPVYQKKIVIGRGVNHVLSIPDNSISRNHVEVEYKDGVILITDLATSNGTKINGEPIPGRMPVAYQPTQVLMLGQSQVLIQFEVLQPKDTHK